MIKINTISNNKYSKRYIEIPEKFIEKKIINFNKKFINYKIKRIFCTLLLSNSKEIKKLNKRFRKKNKSTDVLSFPFYSKKDLRNKLKKEKEIYLGDIIINLEKIKTKKNTNFNIEFNKLWIHGLVHLFGYDHKKDKDFNKMTKVEIQFVSYLH